MVSAFGVGTRDFFCKSCGHAVCQHCSNNRRYLSKDGKEKFRVCDTCDTKLDNIRYRVSMDKLLAVKEEKIRLAEQLLQHLRTERESLAGEIEKEKQTQLKEVESKLADLEKEKQNTKKFDEQIKELKVEITFQKSNQ